jgi:hypothetical protein
MAAVGAKSPLMSERYFLESPVELGQRARKTPLTLNDGFDNDVAKPD